MFSLFGNPPETTASTKLPPESYLKPESIMHCYTLLNPSICLCTDFSTKLGEHSLCTGWCAKGKASESRRLRQTKRATKQKGVGVEVGHHPRPIRAHHCGCLSKSKLSELRDHSWGEGHLISSPNPQHNSTPSTGQPLHRLCLSSDTLVRMFRIIDNWQLEQV